MILQEKIFRKATGVLTAKVIHSRTGAILYEFTQHNIITDAGYHAAAQALAGVVGSGIASLAAGESTTRPGARDAAITGVIVPITSVEYPDNFSVRFNFSINANTANGLDLAEFGLVTQDGRLFSRLVRDEIISKTNGIEIIGGYIINL